jgi:hypothetical protein
VLPVELASVKRETVARQEGWKKTPLHP